MFGYIYAQTTAELDVQLCEWIEHCWSEGDSKSLAEDSISAAQWGLQQKKVFCGSWRLIGVWNKLELPCRAPAMPPEVLLGLAGYFVSIGRPDVTALLLIGFHCMLRTMEMLNIACNHLTMSNNLQGTILLPSTKMSKRRGGVETVYIEDPLTGVWAAWAKSKTPPFGSLLNGTVADFRRLFVQGLQYFGLTQLGFRLYSIRRGGASLDYRLHQSVSRTLFRGRWSDSQVARIYVTEGAQLFNMLQVTEASRKSLAGYAARLARTPT